MKVSKKEKKNEKERQLSSREKSFPKNSQLTQTTLL